MSVFEALHCREKSAPHLLSQPNTAHNLLTSDRDSLIISVTKIDGASQIVSTYRDDNWRLIGAPTNSADSRNQLDFLQIPTPFRDATKQMIYRYMRKGSAGSKRPRPGTLTRVFDEMSYFLRYVMTLGITTLSDITPTACSHYVHASRFKRIRGDKPPTTQTVYRRVKAVENVFNLSQYTTTPLRNHPWPDSSSRGMAGIRGTDPKNITPLIPDEVFVPLFQEAWKVVQYAPCLLDWQDAMSRLASSGRDSKFLRRKRIAFL